MYYCMHLISFDGCSITLNLWPKEFGDIGITLSNIARLLKRCGSKGCGSGNFLVFFQVETLIFG